MTEEQRAELEKLEKLARAATGGDWTATPFEPRSDCWSVYASDNVAHCWYLGEEDRVHYDLDNSEANATFIAAANPATVLDLLATIARLEAEKVKDGEALEPFAKAADFWDAIYPDGEVMMKPAAFVDAWRRKHGRKSAPPQFVVADLRAARARLSSRAKDQSQ